MMGSASFMGSKRVNPELDSSKAELPGPADYNVERKMQVLNQKH
jgi:hypothetical protein